jgi:hypothetical protein
MTAGYLPRDGLDLPLVARSAVINCNSTDGLVSLYWEPPCAREPRVPTGCALVVEQARPGGLIGGRDVAELVVKVL